MNDSKLNEILDTFINGNINDAVKMLQENEQIAEDLINEVSGESQHNQAVQLVCALARKAI